MISSSLVLIQCCQSQLLTIFVKHFCNSSRTDGTLLNTTLVVSSQKSSGTLWKTIEAITKVPLYSTVLTPPHRPLIYGNDLDGINFNHLAQSPPSIWVIQGKPVIVIETARIETPISYRSRKCRCHHNRREIEFLCKVTARQVWQLAAHHSASHKTIGL